MKIVLDFDDTIFNTHRLMREFLEIVKKFGFTEEEFFGAYQECKKIMGYFDPKTIIELLNKAKPFDKVKAEKEIDLILSDLSNFVYSDFFDFVKDFKKESLILLSFGAIDFQEIKIENSGITSYFQEIIITQRDKTEDLKNILRQTQDDKGNEGEKIFFIDDKTVQVDNIKNKFPEIITMKLKRPQGVDIMTDSKITDYTVKNLNEVKEIIFRLGKLRLVC